MSFNVIGLYKNLPNSGSSFSQNVISVPVFVFKIGLPYFVSGKYIKLILFMGILDVGQKISSNWS
jgi:hypothetical protein